MRTMSRVESLQWITDKGFLLKTEDLPDIEPKYRKTWVLLPKGYKTAFAIPNEARSQLTLAHWIANWMDWNEALIWLNDWSIYTEDEMDLFLQLRRIYFPPIAESLIDSPGHYMDVKNTHTIWAMAEFIWTIMAFNWEGYILEPTRTCFVWLADGVLDISTRDKHKHKALHQQLEFRWIKPLKST